MKNKILMYVFGLCIFFIPSYVKSGNNDLPEGTPSGVNIEFLNSHVVPLSSKEMKALKLSEKWTKTDIPPVLSSGGKIIYVHGAVLPSIIGSPMQICDIELEPGEKIKEIVVGDSARWLVESGSSGSGRTLTEHIFVKPIDSGLETTAIITTDRRTYHLRLISRRDEHTPYVGFQYADNLRQNYEIKKAQQEREEHWNSIDIEGTNVDLSNLNFNYSIKGNNVSWKPERVYDDGRQMFIRLPKISGEMPVLLARKKGQDVLVNYRVKDTALVVDAIFDHVTLIIGVGSSQEKVDIRRQN